jgi:hypothetical protein
MNPFFATAGIDGGGICTYLWDNAGYIPLIASLMLDTKAIDMAGKMTEIDLEKYYAFSPDGTGVGVKYSYSPWSFTSLVSAIFKFFGPDKALFEYNKKLILNDESGQSENGLIDYGHQANLLEMRGAGWEHFVVSPNAERSWCFRQLAEMGRLIDIDQKQIEKWEKQAEYIQTAVVEKLWDKDVQWFASFYPAGFKDYVYSIQVYDALRAGVCTPDMEKRLTSELKDGAYLGSHGVSSVSKSDDIHYEVLDPDWSGGGAYIGEGPQLALNMYEKGYADVAWDILKRHFWMGRHFLYYPQETYCDKPMSPANKRANEVSGLAGAEAILFGLIGFQPRYNGELYIQPKLVIEGSVSLKGFGFRNHMFDVAITRDQMTIYRDGTEVYSGSVKKMRIL